MMGIMMTGVIVRVSTVRALCRSLIVFLIPLNSRIMALNFNKYVQDGERFVHEVAHELGVSDDKAKGGRVLRAVFHAFRNRVTPNESLQFISQLPMLIKAIYVDGWRFSDESRRLRHLGDFIEAVREAGGRGTTNDFVTDYEVEAAIRAVFRVVGKHVSEGEILDILATLPVELKPLLADALNGAEPVR